MPKYQNFINVANTYARVFKSLDFQYKRENFETLSEELKSFNIVIVGLRQIGKTTIATQLMQKYLEDNTVQTSDSNDIVQPDESSAQPGNGDEFLYLNMKTFEDFDKTELLEYVSINQFKIVFLDEIQMVSAWTNFAQALIDGNPNTKFILSGSNTAALTDEIMLNRTKVFLMSPLSFNEYENIWVDDNIGTYLKYGSFPIAKGYRDVDHQYLETVEQHIIDRIVTEDFSVSKIAKFKLLMKKMANFIGNDLKLSKVVTPEDGFVRQTAKDYLTIMEKSGLVKVIYKHNDVSNKPIPKAYFADKSMIYKFNSFQDLNNNLLGSLVENVVFNYIDNMFNKQFADTNVFYYRSSKGLEIDFVMPDHKLLIEVKHIEATIDEWTEIVDNYESRTDGQFLDFEKVIITKGVSATLNGWRLIPFEDLLKGGIDVLRWNK